VPNFPGVDKNQPGPGLTEGGAHRVFIDLELLGTGSVLAPPFSLLDLFYYDIIVAVIPIFFRQIFGFFFG
jgi:hypothetical protein